MQKIFSTSILFFLLIFSPISAFSEEIDVLIKGVDDGVKTAKQQDYNEAVMNAMRQAIERAGVEIKSTTEVVNFQTKFDMIKTKAEGILLPGFQIMDMGYQTDGTYQVVLAGKITIQKKKSEQKINVEILFEGVWGTAIEYYYDPRYRNTNPREKSQCKDRPQICFTFTGNADIYLKEATANRPIIVGTARYDRSLTTRSHERAEENVSMDRPLGSLDCMARWLIERCGKDFPNMLQRRFTTTLIAGKKYYIWVHIKNFCWNDTGLVSSLISFTPDASSGQQTVVIPLARHVGYFTHEEQLKDEWPYNQGYNVYEEFSVNVSTKPRELSTTEEINNFIQNTSDFKYILIPSKAIKFL